MNQITILSDISEDVKEYYEQAYEYMEIFSLANKNILFSKVGDFVEKYAGEDYGLLIEDEMGNVFDSIRAFLQTDEIENWVICIDHLSANSFLSLMTKSPLIIDLDFVLNNIPVLETQKLYSAIKQKWNNTPVIGVSQYENVNYTPYEQLKNLMRSNGDSVYEKSHIFPLLPNIIRDKLAIFSLKEIINNVNTENKILTSQLKEIYDLFPKSSGKDYLVGSSFVMRKIYLELQMLRGVDNVRVLIMGEPRTGKELIAKAIAEDSFRGINNPRRPFISINCSEVSRDSDASISRLFGHTKGAFTGAISERKGLFELADNGTVFLDEIGNLPQDAQAKLLRYLETSSFSRLGGDDNKLASANVRIVSATNENLQKLIEDGKFRQDFYSRIADRIITIPPLRERKDDIIELAQYFVNDKKTIIKNFQNSTFHFEFEDDALDILCNYDYPTNVRQLKSLVTNSMIVANHFKVPSSSKIRILAIHVLQAADSTGLTISNSSEAPNGLCLEVESFLDKIEDILNNHFHDYVKVKQVDFLNKFPSTKTSVLGMTRQAFTTTELNPRKSCIRKLLEQYPNRWPLSMNKCQFIKNV